MKHFIFSLIACVLLIAAIPSAQAQRTKGKTRTTRVSNKSNLSPLERKVVGKHMLSLQWISWDYFGSVDIKKQTDGTLTCVGRQDSRENDDYVALDGTIEIVDAKHLKFTGDIKIKIYHINGGKEYVRSGTYDFVAKEKRKYWRLQQMENQDSCVDYVDIYFK